jgi:hypothetical protein
MLVFRPKTALRHRAAKAVTPVSVRTNQTPNAVCELILKNS